MKQMNVNTKWIGLVGNPLGHSMSPIMHNSVYPEMGLDWLYMPMEVKNDQIKDLLTGMRQMPFIGCNVTIPAKVAIMKYLDELDPLAEKIGAVNTLLFDKHRAIGFNTDGEGFVKDLERSKGIHCKGETFLIIGAGGAARAIGMTLATRGAKKIWIANRTRKKADALAQAINDNIGPCSESVGLKDQELKKIINKTQVLINTTSVGLYPHVENLPIEASFIRPHLMVVDIIYNPMETKLLKLATNKGCETLNGVGMFVNQGAEAIQIWSGLQAPVEKMKQIVLKTLNHDR
jgi:shikimate dehydrogenase